MSVVKEKTVAESLERVSFNFEELQCLMLSILKVAFPRTSYNSSDTGTRLLIYDVLFMGKSIVLLVVLLRGFETL